MFDNENQDEALKAFEASLGELRPRADGLDRRMRFLLAQEATLNRNLQDSEVLLGGQCVCVRCGGAISNANKGKHRWAWPAAFSGMTAVAVVLFAMLVVRVGSPNAVTAGKPGTETPFASVGDGKADAVPSFDGNGTRQLGSDSMSYLNLRDQVLRFGVESWKTPVAAVATMNTDESPLNYRKQLDQLLMQDRMHGI